MKNDLFKLLSPSDDTDIEMLAEESPLPDEDMQKRIVEKCLRKSGIEEELTEERVSAEIFSRPRWTRFAASAAALVLAIAGGAGVMMINRSMKNSSPVISESSSVTVTRPAAETFTEPGTSNELTDEVREAAPGPSVTTVTAYTAGTAETSAPYSPAVTATEAVQPETESETESAVSGEPKESDQVIHLPSNGTLPYGYWKSSGSFGEMSWHFYSTNSGAMGECAVNGEYYGFFNYTSDNGKITINWYAGKLACTASKGTISGMDNGPADPFDITWDGGGSDHFTFDPTGDLGIVTTYPGGGDLTQTLPPDNSSSPSGYCLGTFYWNSTGSLGNRSWSFSAGANAGNQGSVGGTGQCTKDGFWADTFSYHAENGRITITSQTDCTTISGTITGQLYNSTAPFDITWDNGETDHFTYNFSESMNE